MSDLKANIRTLDLGERAISYECIRKSVKNLNLRIRPDGTVTVSAPYSVPLWQIEDFLIEKKKFILRALISFEKRAEEAPPNPIRFVKGDTVSLFGMEFRLQITKDSCAKTHIEKDMLILAEGGNTEKRREEFKRYAIERLEFLLHNLCNRVYPLFADMTPSPQIKIRAMTSRWGSCRPDTAVLTFNARLAFYPIPCIEYVVMHEFCHFLYPNHSPEFYDALTKRMPDWEKRKELLNAEPMRDYF